MSQQIAFGAGQFWAERIPEPEQPVNWRDLLLHFDGANGSTVIIDSSVNQFQGQAAGCSLSTAQKKWGTASLRNDGAGFVLFEDPGLVIGTSDFSIEQWVRFDDTGNTQASTFGASYDIIETESGPDIDVEKVWWFYYASAPYKVISFYLAGSGLDFNFTFEPETWYFLQVLKEGENLTLAVNGVVTDTSNVYGDVNLTSKKIYVGGTLGYPLTSFDGLKGYLDDYRLSIGRAMPVGLPTEPFEY